MYSKHNTEYTGVSPIYAVTLVEHEVQEDPTGSTQNFILNTEGDPPPPFP